MLFVIDAKDKPDSFDLRLSTRPDHLDYLKSLGDRLVAAGPFQDEQGRSIGSMVIVSAESSYDAEQIAAQDPYAQAGLFAEVSVRPWVWALKAPEGL